MFVADLHCDTLSAIYARKRQGVASGLSRNDFHIDIGKMEKGGYLLQNFAIYVDLGGSEDPYLCCRNQIELFREELQNNSGRIRQAKTYGDIVANRREGIISAVLTAEEGEICQGDVGRLEKLYGLGVRMMTFTWNYRNSLGYPAVEIPLEGQEEKSLPGRKDSGRRPEQQNLAGWEGRGLTETGFAFLEKMEELGMIPDVSHLSEEGFYDVYRHSAKPFVASHSNAAALCPHRRNLSDDMIRKIAERGGLVGINYYGAFLSLEMEGGRHVSRVRQIADHILHVINTGGIACAALGSDFDGMDGMLEMENCSELGLLRQELRRRGLSESQIEAVCYKNVFRLYEECFPT